MSDEELFDIISVFCKVNKKMISASSSSKTVKSWDSFAMISIALEIETRLNIKIKDNDLTKFSSVKDIKSIILKKDKL